ncbi:MAG TPA: ATP-binding protein [Pyrinomonadaceae bacterium]|jgi:signal transduction histidine kinase|nr:ATP-binding protein [Pyrinomonadaceae bacterium]
MSLLEVLQLIGYSTGAALHLWMGALLWRRRRGLMSIERVLLALTVSFGVWHGCNLIIALQGMLGLEASRWATLLRLADTLAVVSITLSYSFLLHVHLHLWANAHERGLRRGERLRVYLSYIPTLFLIVAVPPLWAGEYAPMFVKLSQLVLPFVLWAAYVLCFIAVTDLLIARRSSSRNERRALQTLAVSFLATGALLVSVYALGLGEGTGRGHYLKTAANLGSLLPSALIAYYIYRYRYLELIIKESLIAATFAAVVLTAYLYGIRTVGAWLTERYNLRAGVVESLLILALALLAAPLRQWIEKRFHNLFQREATLYREVVARIGSQAGQYKQLPELLRFVEERTAQALSLRRVRIVLNPTGRDESGMVSQPDQESKVEHDEQLFELMGQVLVQARANGWTAIEGERRLREHGFEIAYALRREERTVGLMLIDAAADALTPDARAVLEVLAGQVAIAIEDCRLVEENVWLERRLAQGERLAALGQMAATVAHEVRNPLSAIKSIAQVMREDQHLSREYGRDLNLIVGETDRLSRSVTQLLSYARTTPPAIAPCRADELARSVTELFSAEASARAIRLECLPESVHELDGVTASATRDALSNLLLNALQATPAGGTIRVETRDDMDDLLFIVTDSGPGVDPKLRERIWEPFFTTRQRGTGLGLAIVRKRMEDVGGTTRLLDGNGGGAGFELRLPLKSL